MAQQRTQQLTLLGVQVMLDTRVSKSADGTLFTEAGQALPADHVYWCTGGSPCTDFMRASLGAYLDRDRFVRVSCCFFCVTYGRSEQVSVRESKCAHMQRVPELITLVSVSRRSALHAHYHRSELP